MDTISFEAKPYGIDSWIVIRLPEEASAKLPSRALAMVKGTINGFSFQTALEPDGKGSHWFRLTEALQKSAHIKIGDSVKFEIESTKEWIEPEVPEDFKKALSASKKAEDLWQDITPNARWDWIRWIRAVKTSETRQKHIEVALDKLNKGMRRPCCFNRNLCSEPYVSHNWALLAPAQTKVV
jgi:hypothetical protein